MTAHLGITPEAAFNLLAGLVMMGLAAWLIFLDHRSKVNLAFAFFLVMRGLLNLSLALANQPQTAALGLQLMPNFFVIVPFAALAFAVTYRNVYGVTQRRSFPPWVFYGAGAFFVAAYLVAPTLWLDGLMTGPLFAAIGLTTFSFGLVALILGREYIHSEPGPVRRSLLLVSMGFALSPSFVAAEEIVQIDIARFPIALQGIFLDISHYLADAALIPIILLAVMMVRDWAREEDVRVRPETKRFLALNLLAFATAIASAAIFFGVSLEAGLTAFKVNEAIWELSLPLIVTYALLRHQLFDINLKLKTTVRQSAMAGSFGFIFFVSSESLEALVPVDSTILGMVAAGTISLLLAPVQRFAENVADRLLPGVKPIDQMTHREQIALYRDQVKIALADDRLSEKDRTLLDVARERLHVPPEQARRIEEEALREVQSAREGTQAQPE